MNLRKVCKLWRRVALSTHSLWTSAWVNLDSYSDVDLPKAIRGIECYFQRSGSSLPLNIGFHWSRDSEELWSLWMDFLCSFRERWEEISFFTDICHFQLFEERLKKEVDNGLWKALFLQVALEDTPSPDSLIPADSGIFNDLFPDLETVNLNTASDLLITANQPPSRLLDPHTTMRKLRLEVFLDLNPYFHKLGGFPNLKKLLFNCPKLDVTPVLAEGNIIELPNLELLLMACPPSFTILSRLRTPSLKTLQLLTNVPPEPASPDSTDSLQRDLMESFDHVVAFAEQCNKTLRETRINCWFLQAEYALLCLLGALASVEYLCIDTWFRPTEESTPADARPTIVDDILNSTYLSNLHKLCLHDPQDEETPLPAEWGARSLIHLLPLIAEGHNPGDGMGPMDFKNSIDPTIFVGETSRPTVGEVGVPQIPQEQTPPPSPSISPHPPIHLFLC
ncbi:hypothetical protein FA13DRAFT_1068591 [Coprinellus micaceus]|uniref:F-box domain-containing protein n=1 Tax=Coprinellus micaceus TaxID=71717 RepID=A0A4Y7TQT1_COPMI|nr:hypothetical protein FA13DRAFT_1068591 [Coprinellus micaceus]